MKIDNLSEDFWAKMKYVLLFTLSLLIIYVVQTKFIIKLPNSNNRELLSAINNYENVFKQQEEYALKIKKISDTIAQMEFDIHQVQKQDEVNKEIFFVRSIFSENKMNSTYLFGIQSANILQIYFDTKEEQSSLQKNKEILIKSLNECKANI